MGRIVAFLHDVLAYVIFIGTLVRAIDFVGIVFVRGSSGGRGSPIMFSRRLPQFAYSESHRARACLMVTLEAVWLAALQLQGQDRVKPIE